MKIIDISMTIKDGMTVYPGNPPVCIKQYRKLPKASTNLTELKMGSHTGTHIDAPKHINNKGKGVDRISMDKLYGKCQVLNLTKINFGDGIRPEHLEKHKITEKIVLLKTKNREFKKNYIYLTEEAAKYLAKKKIKTVGIDSLSIQKYHTGYCAAHCILLDKELIIFEGLDLSKVKAGKYTFAGLPLKIKNCDGAPARAILIK